MTLIEMLIVVTIIGLITGLTYTTVSAGIDSLRLKQGSDQVVTLFNSALTRATRRELAVEITISRKDRALVLESPGVRGETRVTLPEGVRIVRVLPETTQTEEQPDAPRRFMVYPGGAPPRVGVELANARNVRRIVQVDPITGVPRVESVGAR